MLQASVDDRKEVIERLITTVPDSIKNHFKELDYNFLLELFPASERNLL